MIDFNNLSTLALPQGEVHEVFNTEGIRVWKDPNHILNRIPFSVDTDNTVFNNKGYITGYRLSSSGSLKEQTGSTATGFIPYKYGDIIQMYRATWSTTYSDGYCYILFYDKNFNYLSHINRHMTGASNDNGISNVAANVNKTTSSILTNNIGVTTFDINFTKSLDIAYIRISATSNGTDMVITKNEEITTESLKGLIP